MDFSGIGRTYNIVRSAKSKVVSEMEMKATLYYRNQLDEHDRRIYDSLVKQWMHYEKNIEIDIPHCDLVKLTQAIHWDYPLLFYINYYNYK